MSSPTPTEETFTRFTKDLFDEEVAAHPAGDDPSTFLESIKSAIFSLNDRFSSSSKPVSAFEQSVKDVWHMFIEVAKLASPDDHMQEGLVLLLLSTRALGSIGREGSGEKGTRDPVGASLWADLPHFVPSLLEVWGSSGALSSAQLVNLAAFIARLISIDVFGLEVSAAALWLFKEGIETGHSDEINVEQISACITILQYCGHKLLILCLNGESFEVKENLAMPGHLAQEAKAESGDFSVERWLVWRRKFQIMSRSESEGIRNLGRQGFGCMIGCGREMGVKVPGEDKYFEKVYKALEKELNRGGKESVGLEDIVADPDWVD